MISTKIFAALAVLAVADFAGHTAFAAEQNTSTLSVTVKYADLDLTGREGAQVMATRIHNAARDICGGDEMNADMTQRRLARACVDQISVRAASKLNSALVTAMVGGSAPTSVVMASR